MMEDRTERYFCKDGTGRDLFLLKLYFDHEMGIIFWDISIDKNYLTPDAVDLIKQIIVFDIPQSKRSALIERLFGLLQCLPGIEGQYLSEFYLDKNESYEPNTTSTLEEILRVKNIEQFAPFTENVNAFYYHFLLHSLKGKMGEKLSTVISKESFEENVKKDEQLQFAYVEVYSEKAEYLRLKLCDDDTCYYCYVLVVDSTIKLFFLVLIK
jgi:hypothetical protein